MKTIELKDMTQAERQAFADFIYKESYRHLEDIKNISKDLKRLKQKFGIVPRKIYINTRIEV